MGFNKSEFNFSEVFNNTNGKTSGSGFVGVIGSLFCMAIIAFIVIAIFVIRKSVSPNIVTVINALQSALLGIFTLAGLYAALLGLRKWKGTFSKDSTSTEEESSETTTTSSSSTTVQK